MTPARFSIPLLTSLTIGFAWAPFSAAQTGADRIELAGDRVESLVILGGDNGALGGAYAFRGNTPASLKIDKLGGAGDIGNPQPLGSGPLQWNPTVDGNLGHAVGQSATNLDTRREFSMVGLELGGGARLWMGEHWSTSFRLSGIYGRTKQDFRNGVGEPAPVPQDSEHVDAIANTRLNTWTLVPSTNLQYVTNLGTSALTLSSTFAYFHTESFGGSLPLISLNGNSQSWKNTLDIDVPLGWSLFGHEMHTGGHFDFTELFGDIRTGLDTGHLDTVNARLVFDMQRSFAWLRWLGLEGSYTWSRNLSGWSVGVTARLHL